MPSHTPRVSIGVPVFNGEAYLAQALDSLLDQTWSDMEIIISDNASTDSTEEICREYASHNPRIRYMRNAANIGAAKNFNQLVAVAAGEYFKWAAHDDLCGREFLQRCVEVLDRDDSVVLSYPWSKAINEYGAVVRDFEPMPGLGSRKAHERFFQCVCVPHPQNPIFGLVRTETLRQTRLIGSYISADRVLLGELVLAGRFHEVPEVLFLKRHHPHQHWRTHRTRGSRQAWWDPANVGERGFRTWRLFREHLVSIRRAPITKRERAYSYPYMGFRTWRLFREHLVSIRRAPITKRERACSYVSMGWWIRRNWRSLSRDLMIWRA